MIITFSGHRHIKYKDIVREKLFETLKNLEVSDQIRFYLGIYGDFNKIARECCEKYKQDINPNVKLIFITPYLDNGSIKKGLLSSFDEIVYPQLENVRTQYTLSPEKIWMAHKADILIAYANNSLSGSADMLRYMLRMENKTCINIGKYVLL